MATSMMSLRPERTILEEGMAYAASRARGYCEIDGLGGIAKASAEWVNDYSRLLAAFVAERCAQVVEASYHEPEHEPDEEGALVQDGERAATASHAELIRAAFPMPKE